MTPMYSTATRLGDPRPRVSAKDAGVTDCAAYLAACGGWCGRCDCVSLQAMRPLETEQFSALVADALDSMPAGLAALMDNVAVFVEDESPGEPDLLGLYDGIPLTERDTYGEGLVLPDRITLYRLPLCAMCDDVEHLTEEVSVTVVHELAHHFGIDDERLTELGWD